MKIYETEFYLSTALFICEAGPKWLQVWTGAKGLSHMGLANRAGHILMRLADDEESLLRYVGACLMI